MAEVPAITETVADEGPFAQHNRAILKLTVDLREMDQLVFNMSQQPDWPSMRPHYLRLLELTQARMQQESRRIRDMLVPEITRTYLTFDKDRK